MRAAPTLAKNLEDAGCVAHRTEDQRCIPLSRFDELLLDVVVNRRLERRHKPCAHIHSVGAER